MDSGTLYCNACGTAISNLSRYCSNCGRAVAHSQCAPKLARSRVNRKIAGVCAGLAEHLDLDTSLRRLCIAIQGIKNQLSSCSGPSSQLEANIFARLISAFQPATVWGGCTTTG